VAAVCHVGDLGGVEELGGRIIREYVDDHGVSDAGDEIADVFLTGKRRHGVTVGLIGFSGGIVFAFAFCALCLIHACPGVQTAGDGEVSGGGDVFVRLDWGGDGLRGFCHAGLPDLIVREKTEIICKEEWDTEERD
jgi:hypothetical protein